MNKHPEGSKWHKWDLHVHTPKSIIQQFGGDTTQAWDDFFNAIANLPPEIKVIGITDYLFCNGYEHVLANRSRIPNMELIIPNIEFRLNTFSGTDHNHKRHNFHVLFDPTIPVDTIRSQFLNGLSTAYLIEEGSEWNQTPTIASLEELGRRLKEAAPAGNSIHSKSDLEVGFSNITYKREDIEKLLQKSPFKGKCITAIGFSEWDQSRWNQSAAEKRNLVNKANFCLTGNPDPAKILENRQDLKRNNLRDLVLHSSDAHNLHDLGKTKLWIKANPTFAGLKQVLNEPDSRVFNGEEPPKFKLPHQVIRKITIPQSKGWFLDNFSLELNPDLVALIGGRGSGKSGLVEAIAYGAGSKDDDENAFLKKAAKHKNSITGEKIIIEWGDGSTTEQIVGSLKQDMGRVQYLPQGVVEELCSPKKTEVLQKQIEHVIFQALSEGERSGASSFEELIKNILYRYESQKNQIIEKIQSYNKRLAKLYKELRQLPDKKQILEDKKAELVKTQSSLPVLPPDDLKSQEELTKLYELKKKFEQKIIDINKKLDIIRDLQIKVKALTAKISEFGQVTGEMLTQVEITDTTAFQISFDSDAAQAVLLAKMDENANILTALASGHKTEVAGILNLPETDLLYDNLEALKAGIKQKEDETQGFESTKIQYQKLSKDALEIETNIKALENEITSISTNHTREITKLERERFASYGAYFTLLAEEKDSIEKLYTPLQKILSEGTDTDKKLVFEAQIDYKIDNHNRAGLNIIDRSHKGNFREVNKLNTMLSEFWDECIKNDFSLTAISQELDKVNQAFLKYEGADITIEEQLRSNYTLEDFFNWLYDPSHFSIISSLKFDDTSLYLLSPGQKGIILLMLYLEIDKVDNRPLIIDQPEENLDNLSVYQDLIGYFRARKQYRQIIIVTHNPNLVVNTDAEQIIIANYDGRRTPRLQYIAGSLENIAEELPTVAVADLDDGIIEQVCKILEGGEIAFDKRKRKYQISIKSNI